MSNSVKMVEISPSERSRVDAEDLTEKEKEKALPMLIIFLAEVLGTAILMFVGCMGTCADKFVDVPVVPQFGGIGFGLAVLTAIQIVGHISGAHFNPQVTMAAYILGKIKLTAVPLYVAAEFIGALLGFGLLKIVIPPQHSQTLCDTMPHADVTVTQALIIEIAITSVLILTCCAVWDPRNAKNTDSVALRFGLIVACISITAGVLTAASMNTARSFAPALINGNWNYHWIYWIGPTVGSLIASLFYKYILIL